MHLSEIKIIGIEKNQTEMPTRPTKDQFRQIMSSDKKADKEMIQSIGMAIGKLLNINVYHIDRPPFVTRSGKTVQDNRAVTLYVSDNKVKDFIVGLKETEIVHDGKNVVIKKIEVTGKKRKVLTIDSSVKRVDEEESNRQLEHHLAVTKSEDMVEA